MGPALVTIQAIGLVGGIGLQVMRRLSQKQQKQKQQKQQIQKQQQRQRQFNRLKDSLQKRQNQLRQKIQLTHKLYCQKLFKQIQGKNTDSQKMQKRRQQFMKEIQQQTSRIFNLRNKQQLMQKEIKQSKIKGQVIIYTPDPELIKRVQQLEKMIKQSQNQLVEARKKAMQQSNPKQLRQRKNQIFTAFLGNLKAHKFTQKIVKKKGKKYHIVIGPISVGKSCLLNKFLDIKLPTGIGQTTLSASIVASSETVQILDSPGANDDFNFYDIATLSLFHSVDRVFLLYRTCLKDVKDIMRILNVIQPDNTYLVRTQCDAFGKNDIRGLQEELDRDRQYVQQVIGQNNFKVFATSSKENMSFQDNQIVAKLLKGKDYDEE